MPAAPARPFDQTWPYRVILLAGGTTLAVILWNVLCLSPLIQWNAARLAPAFALARGLPIYALRDSGAHLGWFYGPVFPLWYLPVAFLDHPTTALMLAGIMNFATWLLPVALVLRAAGARPGAAAAGGVLAGLLMLGNAVTNYGLYWVHVDAVCIACGLLACLALHHALQGGRRAGLPLAAAALAVAFWTKMLALMLVPALLCWLWRERRSDLIRPFLFWCAVCGGILTAAVLAAFGPEQIIFNMWLIQALTPWRGGPALLADELGRLVTAGWPWLPALALGWWMGRASPVARLPEAAGRWVRLLLWIALWQAPLGLIAVLRAGGGLNSLHSVHFLLLAGLIVLTHALAKPARHAGWAGLLWLLTVLIPLLNAGRIALSHSLRWMPDPSQEKLLAVARENPGRCYFPWNPMITIITEHRISPLDDALYCLWLAQLEPPAERIRAAVPANPIIMYVEPAQSRFVLRYLKKSDSARKQP